MRVGAAYFLEPSEPAQRRYEALRAYFVDGLLAGEVARRFGYSPASVHQMASELRAGSAQYFRSSKPGPRSALKAQALGDWPAQAAVRCDHAGLFLLAPAIAELGFADLAVSCGYPSTTVLSAWHSLGTLLLHKCARTPRASHAFALADDPGLALLMGLTALPKATHLTSYSYRARRTSSEKLLAGVTGRLRELGLATGAEGFNLDFHTIRHHGADVPLEKHYVPQRSQRTRAVLTFFAQDHASQEMVYSNAELTKAEQAREVIAFADYWQQIAGADPGLLLS